jgi:uncharacterized protein YjiS (DUF1127 family)
MSDQVINSACSHATAIRLLGWLSHVANRCVTAARQRRGERQSRRMLASLNDHLLADIGVTREQRRHVVWPSKPPV